MERTGEKSAAAMGECDRLGQGGGANGVSRFDGLIGGGASWCSRDVGVPETCVRCTIPVRMITSS